MLSLQENKKTWFHYIRCVCVYHVRREEWSHVLPGSGCQEVLFYNYTRLLARQSSLITPLVSWVDKVHASTIGV